MKKLKSLINMKIQSFWNFFYDIKTKNKDLDAENKEERNEDEFQKKEEVNKFNKAIKNLMNVKNYLIKKN